MPVGVNLPAPFFYGPTPFNRNVLCASPLVTAVLFYDVTLCRRALGCFISFMCVGHLNLNLSVYDSQTASPASAFPAYFSIACKTRAVLLVLGTCCSGPPAKRKTPMLSVTATLRNSICVCVSGGFTKIKFIFETVETFLLSS